MRTIAVVGSGELAAATARALAAAGHRVRLTPELDTTAPADLTVVARERATFGELLDLAGTLLDESQVAVVLTIEGDAVVAGPVTVPGVSACLECRLLISLGRQQPDAVAALQTYTAFTTGRWDDAPTAAEAMAATLPELVDAIERPSAGRRPFTAFRVLLDSTVSDSTTSGSTVSDSTVSGSTVSDSTTSGTMPSAVESHLLEALPDGRCQRCARRSPAGPAPAVGAALAEIARVLEAEGVAAEAAPAGRPTLHPDAYRTVGVLGGGTAGYLAALALRTRLPHLDVSLVESSRVPIISVGEATTSAMVQFLHSPEFLGFDIVDFFERVRPTFKLGIRFLWGGSDDRAFNYPFQYAPLVDPMVHEDHLDGQSVASALMSAERAPLVNDGAGGAHSLLTDVRFAYHLDNVRLVQYLAEQAARLGIHHVDATISDVVLTPDGAEVDHLVSDAGRQLRFDLYVDASGFRSLLLEGALGSPFVSYAPSLLTDRAIAADAPHGGVVKPYTEARTMPAGWCWTIPFEDANHVGYVYASSFTTEAEALADLQRTHPGLGEHRVVQFRSGRHEHFMRGNVVAIGNAYAFVEPLESTALHMVIYELEHLVNHFPHRRDEATARLLNRRMADLWDELRWFLAIHYRFNHRLDTDFWRAVRADTDVSGALDRLALFAERAPLSDRPSLFYSAVPPDFFADDHAFDTLLVGQGVAAALAPARRTSEEFARRAELRRQIAERCLPQADALVLLRDRSPDLLRAFVAAPGSWLHRWIAR